MKLYKINENGELIEGQSDKGYYGEDVYNPREWLPVMPPIEAGKVARVEDGKWILHKDDRGTYYRTDSASEVKIDKPFQSLEGLTDKKPVCEYPKWNGKEWKVDTDLKNKDAEYKTIQDEEKLIQAEIRKQAILSLGNKLKKVKA